MINFTQLKNLQKCDIVGYDLDGTICEPMPKRNKPFFKQNKQERDAYKQLRKEHAQSAKVIGIPNGQYYIITARKQEEAPETLAWLSKNGLNPKQVFFFNLSPKIRKNIVKYKSDIINQLGINIYFEDDARMCRAITKQCKNTEVINIK